MLMVSRFDSCCRKCGFPVFEGDVFDYQPDTHYKVQCIKCYKEVPPESPCPHYFVWKLVDKYTSSKRHKNYTSGTRNHMVHCYFCKKEFNSAPVKALCFESLITYKHGANSPTYKKEFTILTSNLQRQKPLIKMMASVIYVMLQKNQFPDSLISAANAQIDRLIDIYQGDQTTI
ncbi:hypothetical protein BSK52_05925 [Paenibacillus odorifer]|uniref:Uncharacterized protein n=1 Tax=Paenibacillus odorifer TaxID=189426 RepID=A0A1R0Y6Q8_9BACL|nr:hypothetical protein BSK52_05925 [Paenibacillus odorifer]